MVVVEVSLWWWVWFLVFFFFFGSVSEVMVIDYDGWLCWQWVLRGGCGWSFLPNRKERESKRQRI